MYLSLKQVATSLTRLKDVHPFFGMPFLAFKNSDLPIGKTCQLNFSQSIERILDLHYKPSSEYAGYYNPFRSSDQAGRWVAPRYGSTTLQRITKDTFGDSLLHPSKTEWGWRFDYIEILRDRHLRGRGVPAFDLGVWLFRDDEWPDELEPEVVQGRLFDRYNINSQEIDAICETSYGVVTSEWLSSKPIRESDLFSLIGVPPGMPHPGAPLWSNSTYGRLVRHIFSPISPLAG